MKLTDKTIIRTLGQQLELLRQYRVKKIGLFGSFGRGDQKRGSDIDLLVEFDVTTFDENFSGYYDNYLALMSKLGKIFQRKVDLVTEDMISPYIKPLMSDQVRYVETT